MYNLGAFPVLRNADGVGFGGVKFSGKKRYEGLGGGPISRKKALRNITLEWPLTSDTSRF